VTPLQVNEMFKSYTDESDRTFLTEVQIGLYLSAAYSDFRSLVCQVDPFIYSIEYVFAVSDSNEFDLSLNPPAPLTPLLGPNAVAGTKLERLLRVARVDSVSGNAVITYLNSAASERRLPLWGYALVKNKLIFNGRSSNTYRLEYVPMHNVDFANSGAISTYIDDLDTFHDMIPLMAYQRYAIRDGAESPQVLRSLAQKKDELSTFLESGRSREASSYVGHELDGSI
tara:strand:- start:2609 stop:3289 length:681 start_codon:yes stop_codon:yes gene_type:complete